MTGGGTSTFAFGIGLLAVLGLGAAIAIPNLTRSTCSGGNETAAIATLRNLGSAQAMFQRDGHCDVDDDGIGEFGTFGEMTGADGVRADPAATTRRDRLSPTVLSASLAAVNDDGIVTKSGHAFRIFLPGSRGAAVHEGKAGWTSGGPGSPGCCGRPPRAASPIVVHPGGPFSGPVLADGAETAWCAYAWPVAAGNSGQRVLFVDQGGEVWRTANADSRYSGVLGGPAWDAAMPAGSPSAWSPAPETKAVEEYRGRDGNLWKRVN